MKPPSHSEALQVLLLQAADKGRGPVLFGESLDRLRNVLPPFLIGESFPEIHLEHPLIGKPFIDATVLYSDLQPGLRVDSPLAGEHGAMLDWFANEYKKHDDINFGFELDTKEEVPPVAGVHFQPRLWKELVPSFCELVGEPERATLYLDLNRRLPDTWPLSFFGLFRGRPESPLRVCGYLENDERLACAEDPTRLPHVFDSVGFTAYDDTMLRQTRELLVEAPGATDFQFDVYPNGSLGSTFAVDIRFGAQQPDAMRETFESGPAARIMGLLQRWGAADERWKLAAQATFARALPVELPGDKIGLYAFTLMPQWVKARWTNAELQPSKLYLLARGSIIDRKPE